MCGCSLTDEMLEEIRNSESVSVPTLECLPICSGCLRGSELDVHALQLAEVSKQVRTPKVQARFGEWFESWESEKHGLPCFVLMK